MAPALQTSKRKFYKLLDSLTNHQPQPNSSNSSKRLPTTANGSSATLASITTTSSSSALEPPSKRVRPISQPPSITTSTNDNKIGSSSSSSGGIVSNDDPSPSIRIVPSSSTDSLLRSTTTTTTTPSRAREAGSYTRASIRPKTAEQQQQQQQQQHNNPTPNYTPWSQAAFLQRLHTFATITRWTPKPAPVDEVAWARRGWVCDAGAYNTVACRGGCEARVVVALRPLVRDEQGRTVLPECEDMLAEIGEELVGAVREKIVLGHGAECLWRRRGCAEDVYRIRMADPLVWKGELRERYASLSGLGAYVPEVVRLPEGYDLEEMVKSAAGFVLPGAEAGDARGGYGVEGVNSASGVDVVRDESVSGGGTRDKPHVNEDAFALALFGWSTTTQHGLQLLHCTRCFARQGVWLLTSKKIGSMSRPDPPPPPMAFNVDEAHREHCPWVNAHSQKGLGSFEDLNAWQVLVELIKAHRARPGSEEADGEDGLWSEKTHLSKEEIEKLDKERESKLKRIKRAFTVRQLTAGKKE